MNIRKRIALIVSVVMVLMAMSAPLPVSAAGGNGYASMLWGTQGADRNDKAWLYQRDDGGVTRVEDTFNQIVNQPDGGYYTCRKIIVEDYDTNFNVQKLRMYDLELPLFGGFYAGEEYNYLIFGQGNQEDSDDNEVIRVVKYSKDWVRLDDARVYGANTHVPFEFGAVRCTEAGDILYVHTCHVMYKSNDGRHHQANMTFTVNQKTMDVVGTRCSIGMSGTGYVSHSFNQYILVDSNGKLATLDLGDAYPRAAIISRFAVPAASGDLYTGRVFDWDPFPTNSYVNSAILLEFEGALGENEVGCAIGGFSCSDDNYIAAFDYTPNRLSSDQSNIYVIYTDCNTMENETVLQLTHYDDGTSVSSPKLVKFSDDRFLVMWMPHSSKGSVAFDDFTSYTFIDGSGKQLTDIKTVKAKLSACQPVVVGDKAIWYVTGGLAEMSQWGQLLLDTPPTFYAMDISGKLTTMDGSTQSKPIYPSVGGFTDVFEGQYFADAVQWAVEKNITAGTSATTFSPDQTCTQAQIITFLYRAMGEPAVGQDNPYTNPAIGSSQYYYKALLWAYEKGIVKDASISPSAPCKRSDVVSYLWRLSGSPAATSGAFADVPDSAEYAAAVAWAVQMNITSGTSATTFSPNATCTRGQIVTFLRRNSLQ